MPRTPLMSVPARFLPTRPRFAALAGALAGALVLGAASVASAQGTVPESHTVRPGDTLWDISKRYLGDPFLWPDIYRLNTSVVEDPHWIYPGEVLRLAPSAAATAVPPTDTPAVAAADSAADDTSSTRLARAPQQPYAGGPVEPASDESDHLFPPARGRSLRETLTAVEFGRTHTLRRSEFYSSGFLTEEQQLPFGRVIGPVTPLQIYSVTGQTSSTLYTKVAVTPPAGGSYDVGDSLIIADVSKPIAGWGRVVEPRALARVVELSKGHPIVSILALYGEVLPGQAVLPAEKFADAGTVRPEPVSDGLQAQVIGWPGRREMKGPGVVLFIDKGRQDGVAPGDVFEIRREARVTRAGAVRVNEPMAVLQVVHVRERSATARVVNVYSPDVAVGARVYQVAKLPS
ncbi:MAG TPA: LysM peptidoglycan-binding domain-containing protein [Gemmatimonadales bacterium]|nr:LysM peptidoglycan-binding domain-containing protein [Gemmatimonadales bacterium]